MVERPARQRRARLWFIRCSTILWIKPRGGSSGDIDNALDLIDEIVAQIERPGWEERRNYAEILRLRGWMLLLKGDLEGAEGNFLDAVPVKFTKEDDVSDLRL